MLAVYCEIIKYAIGNKAASECTLSGQVYDLQAATRICDAQFGLASLSFA